MNEFSMPSKEKKPERKIEERQPAPGSFEETKQLKTEAGKALEKAKATINGNQTIISIPSIKATFTVNRKMTRQEIDDFKKERVHEHFEKWDKLKKA